MNRNTESHFANLPTVNIGRSKFNREHTNKTTFNTSELVPVYVDMDIVPGDTVSMKQSEIVRMMTPIAPVMDNAFMDFYWFFVPNRLVWDNFKMMMGENETAPWTQTVEKTIPQIKITNDQVFTLSGVKYITRDIKKGSVLNHMGIPITPWKEGGVDAGEPNRKIEISALPTRAYCLIWNEFFRDENLQNPVNISKGDATGQCQNEWTYNYRSNPDAYTVANEQYGGLPCLKVCKPHDYFTSALPGAQKGPAVALPLSEDKIPVTYGNEYTKDPNATNQFKLYNDDYNKPVGVYSYTNNDTTEPTMGEIYENETSETYPYSWKVLKDQTYNPSLYNLEVDLTKATGATVTALRQAFAIQKFYERDARGGTRYIESVKSHFGVTNPDFRLQRPEYLGGFRQNINMNQVLQDAPVVTTNGTPLGTTGAYSVTTHQNGDVFTHSFTEHGILMGLCCIRTEHTYQQGINRSWFKKKRLDFYSPEFANLSEQAILNQEIYAQGTPDDTEAFGYQECWAEMRYLPNICSGEIAGTYGQTLQYWTYADMYTELPSLGDKWIKETPENMQRTLAVQNHDQFIADFYFAPVYTRPLPLYSIPGLIDHH